MSKVYKSDTGWVISKAHKKVFTRVKVKSPNMPQGKIKKERRYFCQELDELAIALNNSPRLADCFDFNVKLETVIDRFGLDMGIEKWYAKLYPLNTSKRQFLERNLRFASYGVRETALFSWFTVLAADVMANRDMEMVYTRYRRTPMAPTRCSLHKSSPVLKYTKRRGGTKDLVNILVAMFGSRNTYGDCYGHIQ